MALLPSTLTIPRERRRLGTGCWCSITRRAANYYRWAASFPDDIEVWLIELPGRGKSLGTRAIDTLSELIDFLRALRPLLPRDYSVFGQHGGADRVLFRARYGQRASARLARCVRHGCAVLPHRHAPLDGAPVHRRNDADIVDYVVSLGGTPREVAEHDALRAMLLKLARRISA